MVWNGDEDDRDDAGAHCDAEPGGREVADDTTPALVFFGKSGGVLRGLMLACISGRVRGGGGDICWPAQSWVIIQDVS